MSEQEFIKFILNRGYNENMFNKDGTLNKNYNSSKVTGIISTILEEYSDEFFNKYGEQINKYRPNAYDEIKKVIDCHNKNLGCSLYQCPSCGDIVFMGHTCKSHLCTSCGYKYKNERVENILETAYACNHRQIVFTISKKFKSLKDSVEYVTRYCGRPAISENRIINYDGENVTFCYNAYEDESYHEVTTSAIEFIKLLIRHLVSFGFKTIRYYGFYRKKPSCFDKINKLINKEKHSVRRMLLKHRLSIMKSFNRDLTPVLDVEIC